MLSNLGVRYYIILEFMVGWEGKVCYIYYNLFNWILNKLEIFDMRFLEGKIILVFKNLVLGV